MNQGRYLKEFNHLKATMMLLIIMYHSIALWLPEGWFNQAPEKKNISFSILAQWLNLIHIYVYIFISGYIYSYLRFSKRKYNTFREFVKKKICRLIIPYITFGTFWCIPFYILFYQPNFEKIMKNYILGYAPAQLWYLLMLFVLFLIIYFPSKLIIKSSMILLHFTCFTIYLSYIAVSTCLNFPFQILSAIKFIPFFIYGMNFEKYDKNFCKKKIAFILLICVNLILFILYLVIPHSNVIYKILGKIIEYFISITGILFMIQLNHIVKYLTIWSSKLYKKIEKNSFGLYLIHQQIIWCVITIFNRKVCSVMLVLLNFSISFVISIIFTEILRANRITRRFIGEAT